MTGDEIGGGFQGFWDIRSREGEGVHTLPLPRPSRLVVVRVTGGAGNGGYGRGLSPLLFCRRGDFVGVQSHHFAENPDSQIFTFGRIIVRNLNDL